MKNITISQHEKFIDDQYIKGMLIPDEVQIRYNNIFLQFGTRGRTGYEVSLQALRNGLTISPNYIDCIDKFGNHENAVQISVQLINNRLSISSTFYNFKTDNFVAKIDKNRLIGLNREIVDFSDNDKFFEVIYNGNNVILSLQFENPNTISILGIL